MSILIVLTMCNCQDNVTDLQMINLSEYEKKYLYMEKRKLYLIGSFGCLAGCLSVCPSFRLSESTGPILVVELLKYDFEVKLF